MKVGVACYRQHKARSLRASNNHVKFPIGQLCTSVWLKKKKKLVFHEKKKKGYR
jgi:hypothetical protein